MDKVVLPMYQFRNDYSFGAHPKVLEAVLATNLEGLPGYGDDEYCARAVSLIRDLCQAPEADVHFFIGGTAANLITIAGLLRPWEGVVCAQSGHINGHEAGAVEATGHKVIPVPVGPDGKLTPELVQAAIVPYQHSHMVQPGLLYISDATETGGIYTSAELEQLYNCAHSNNMFLFLDGARLGCALTAQGNDLTLPDLARFTDAFYIGGTKNGALMGEALVLQESVYVPGLFRLKKQRGGVLAKGWLLGAQFEALLTDGLYFQLARHANEMAQKLQQGLKDLGVSFFYESPTNQIFPIVPNLFLPILERHCAFEIWGPAEEPNHTVIRFVSSFATKPSEVDGLIQLFASHR